MDLPKRKNIRLREYNYSEIGCYFVTVCTKDRKPLLCNIVGTGVPDRPKIKLSEYGIIADKYINQLKNFYKDISIDKYVIMPDHIIRSKTDYNEIWEYIENNPKKWYSMNKK